MTIAVVVTRRRDAPRLVHWAALLGRARAEDVVVLHVVRRSGENTDREVSTSKDDESSKPVLDAAGRALALLPVLPSKDEAGEDPPHTPDIGVRRLEGEDLVELVLGKIRELKAKVLILGRQRKPEGDSVENAPEQRLFREASCDTLLIRTGEDVAETAERILVPTARNPHAGVALDFAEALAKASGGTATALYVQTQFGEDARALAEGILADQIGGKRPHLIPMVVMGQSIRAGVTALVETEGYDLVLVGTANPWFGRRLLFGTLPDEMMSGPDGTSVALIRKAMPLAKRLDQAILRLVEGRIPQLGLKDRVQLAKELRESSRWNFDFIFLTCLSTLIASLGLVANNVAVIIGAMLVAPLMTPLVGSGLALVQGNVRLLRGTLASVLQGFILAFCIALAVGFVAGGELTPQMASRGRPELLDLGIALFSGMAAAYAIARPKLRAALPGVAISAALVPPIATAALALFTHSKKVAAGAALLFLMNIVAIILGAAASHYTAGVRSQHLYSDANPWTRRLLILVFLLGAIGATYAGLRFTKVHWA